MTNTGVYIDGRDAGLTQNEFKLVALLGRFAGRVLTYDYLIREIWGPNKAYDNQILRVNMANIRRKIEKNPAEPEYIFTEVGVGYRNDRGRLKKETEKRLCRERLGFAAKPFILRRHGQNVIIKSNLEKTK